MTISAPKSSGRCSAGEQKQLSTASHASFFFATAASAAMFDISVSGLEGVSIKSSFVLGFTADSQACISVAETNVVSILKLLRILNRFTVAPNRLREATMWSPAESRPITQERIADIPEEVATQASAPSSAASRSSKAVTVGLVKREYIFPASAPEKRAAAWAALSKTKLEVRNRASECSLNWLR